MGAREEGYTQLTDETELLLPSDLLIAVHYPHILCLQASPGALPHAWGKGTRVSLRGPLLVIMPVTA